MRPAGRRNFYPFTELPLALILARMNYLARARQVFAVEIAGLEAVSSQLDGQFARAVEAMIAALARRGKIVVVGIGKSGNIGRKIAADRKSVV